MRLFLACLVWFLSLAVAAAQERPRTILVLDGSGSMWGQIEGVAKITIAQEVVGDLLQSLPANQELGLTVYGHRRKGDCSDIETIVAPGAETRAAIGSAVNAIKPKGKTPMTDAVIAAAEALRYTEDKATVILVSDGIETCAPDPCAAARALEEAGVDFTAHVVGFDVSDPEALKQMQCLADETGGTFRTASNAAELGEALAVVAEPAPPAPVTLTALAYEMGTGQRLSQGLVWTLTGPDGVMIDYEILAQVSAEVLPGSYTVGVLRTEDEASAEASVEVGGKNVNLRLNLPEILRPAALAMSAREEGGGNISRALVWSLYDRNGAAVFEGSTGATVDTEVAPGRYRARVVRPEDGAQAELEFAVLKQGTRVTLTLPPFVPPVTIDAPASAPVGSEILVDWTGPNEQNDYISIARVGDRDNTYVTYEYTRQGPTLAVTMPPEPGTYELRYVLSNGRTAIARRAIEATPVEVSLSAPENAPAGADVMVEWTGPAYANDYISVAEVGAKNNIYINYAYTREGSPLAVQMPVDAGTYELRYVMAQGRTVLATRVIAATDVEFTVSGPATGIAGDTIAVNWTGGDYQNDYISVAEVGAKDNQYVTYTYTRAGSPLDIRLPLEAGDYELRYVVSQDRTVKARQPLRIDPVLASITAAESVAAGARLQVQWDGPGYQSDFIAIADKGSKENQYVTYTNTRQGTPLNVQAPSRPGTYEVRYVAVNVGRKVLTSVPLTVTDVSATLTGPGTAAAGGEVLVSWQGPGYARDYVAIFPAGDEKRYTTYRYTRDGAELAIKAPKEPGAYEIRYVMGQDRRILASIPLTVE